MTALNLLLVGFYISLTSLPTDSKKQLNNIKEQTLISRISNDFYKKEAFQVLTTKCNICHIKQNRRRVFTMENMNSMANDVYKQVFIKKRMPKGKKIKLSDKEYQQLLSWITSIKKQ